MINKMFDKIWSFFSKAEMHQHPQKKNDSAENISVTEEFERCVLCGELTGVPVSMPIDWRENYEIGIGQVCAQCAKKE